MGGAKYTQEKNYTERGEGCDLGGGKRVTKKRSAVVFLGAANGVKKKRRVI